MRLGRVFSPYLKRFLAWVTGLTAGLNTRKYANVCILLFGNSTTVCELQYTVSSWKLFQFISQFCEISGFVNSQAKIFSLARHLAFSNQLGNFISARFKMIEVILLVHTYKIEVTFDLNTLDFGKLNKLIRTV